MVTSAAVLLAAILVLGGLLAVLGDRLGTKVGKARLRLFGLRPRQTATVVTILTGTAIAASTLSLLFAFSKPLRQGVFEIDEILAEVRKAQGDLENTKQEKARVEQELGRVTQEKSQVEQGLLKAQKLFSNTNQQVSGLKTEVTKLREERQKLAREREKLTRDRAILLEQRNDLLARLPQLQGRVEVQEQELVQRRQTIDQKQKQIAKQDRTLQEREKRLQQLQTQRQTLQEELNRRDSLISDRDRAIAELDTNISRRDRALKEREKQLARLEQHITLLRERIQTLGQNYQGLRQGTLAIARGQVLGFGVVRIVDSTGARNAIDQLLREANRAAIIATQRDRNSANERVVKISQSQVEQLASQIQDGRDYVVRILSASNYVENETSVLVFGDVALNKELFKPNEVLATVTLESSKMTSTDLENRLDLLLAQAQSRARRAGLLGDIQVGESDSLTTVAQIVTLNQFIEQLQNSPEEIDRLQVVVTDTTYTAGPLKLRLVALRDGKVAFTTQF